jgi:hypothetical protein
MQISIYQWVWFNYLISKHVFFHNNCVGTNFVNNCRNFTYVNNKDNKVNKYISINFCVAYSEIHNKQYKTGDQHPKVK